MPAVGSGGLLAGPWPHFEREGFTILGMWSVLVVQSEQRVICRLVHRGGAGGPRLAWRGGAAMGGSSRQLALMCVCVWGGGEGSRVGSAMLAASQLPGRGPTDVNDGPAPAH